MSARKKCAHGAVEHVLLLDRHGYGAYRRADQSAYFDPDRHVVRLVTDTGKLAQAWGPELEAVVGLDLCTIEATDNATELRLLDRAAYFLAAFGTCAADRIVTIAEKFIERAGELRRTLGLEGLSLEHSLLFRDKIIMKEYLAERGIPVPACAAYSLDAARRLQSEYGRVVVKPTRGLNSTGVYILDTSPELQAFDDHKEHRRQSYEVEQFLAGDQFHVDSVVRNGEIIVAKAGRRVDSTLSYLHSKPCRSIGVDAGLLQDMLLEFNTRVLACYPWYSGVTNVELFLTEYGPVFGEIAARPGGGGLVPSFRERTGIDLREMAVLAQLDGFQTPQPRMTGYQAGYAMVYAPVAGVLEKMQVPEADWIVDVEMRARTGDLLAAPTAWGNAISVICVRGHDANEVTSRLDAAVAEFLAGTVIAADQ